MASFGHTGQGTTLGSPLAADQKVSLRVIAPEDGVVTALFVEMVNSGSDIQVFRVGIYNDAPTISGATLVDQSDIVALAPGMTRQWVEFRSGINAAIVSASAYWLTLHSGTTGGNASYYFDSGVGSQISASDVFSDGLASTYGTATSSSNSLAIYAEYTSSSARPQGLKHVTLGRKYALAG